MVNIDYFIGSSENTIREKCLKGYQDNLKYLIIFPLQADHQISFSSQVPFRDKILVSNPTSFAKFMNYGEKVYREFLILKNHIRKVNTLNWKEKPIKGHYLIKTKFNYSQNELEQYLRKNEKLDLLGYNRASFF